MLEINKIKGFEMKTIKINNVSVEVTEEQLIEALKEFDKPEFDYPICCKSKIWGSVVLFTDLRKGTVLCKGNSFHKVGFTSWTSHTDRYSWEEIPYDKERGFYHKQLIYCWDDDDTHCVDLKFYDAINKYPFTHRGKPNGYEYQNYSATLPNHMKEFEEN